MNKEETIAALETIESSLRALKSAVSRIRVRQVNRNDVVESAQRMSRQWFEIIEAAVASSGVQPDVIAKYHSLFDELIGLSFKHPSPSTYARVIDGLLRNFKQELIAAVMKSSGPMVGVSQLDKIYEKITDEAERDYLTEAVNCAKSGFLRASTVLGWDAAVHRMHRTVEKAGFEVFNKKSEEMKKIDSGRYKWFKKSFNIHSIAELRATVFDTDLLWMLEYMGLIDSNQHDRLEICFTMRNNCAHPGEAPLTEENLASFYSDLKIMIFDNLKFKV